MQQWPYYCWLLGVAGWRDELIGGEALWMEQQVFCVSFRTLYCKRNLFFEDYISHTIRHTHTLSLSLSLSRLLARSLGRTHLNKWTAGRTDRYLHNTQKQQTNNHSLGGIRTCVFRNQGVATYALDCMTIGISRYIIT